MAAVNIPADTLIGHCGGLQVKPPGYSLSLDKASNLEAKRDISK